MVSASKWISTLTHSLPQGSHSVHMITASTLTGSQPSSVSQNTIDHSLHICTTMTSVWISRLAQLQPTSSLHDDLNVHHHTCLMMTSKFTWSCPPSVSKNLLDYGLKSVSLTSHDHGLHVHPRVTQSQPPSVSLTSFNRSHHPSASPISLRHSLQSAYLCSLKQHLQMILHCAREFSLTPDWP